MVLSEKLIGNIMDTLVLQVPEEGVEPHEWMSHGFTDEPAPVLGRNCFLEMAENGLACVYLFNRLKSEKDIELMGGRLKPPHPQWQGEEDFTYDDVAEFERMFNIITPQTRDMGAWVLLCDNNGHTMLHKAALKGCFKVAKFLLDRTQTLNIDLLRVRGTDGKIPYDIAVDQDFPDMAELLS